MENDLHGAVIRICLKDSCGAVYKETSARLDFIKPCKKCGANTGFKEDVRSFIKYVDRYGVDTEKILDKDLRQFIEQYYHVGG